MQQQQQQNSWVQQLKQQQLHNGNANWVTVHMRNFQFDFRYVLNGIKAASATFCLLHTYSTPVSGERHARTCITLAQLWIWFSVQRAPCNVRRKQHKQNFSHWKFTDRKWHAILSMAKLVPLSLYPTLPPPLYITLPVIPACSCSLGRVKKLLSRLQFFVYFSAQRGFLLANICCE